MKFLAIIIALALVYWTQFNTVMQDQYNIFIRYNRALQKLKLGSTTPSFIVGLIVFVLAIVIIDRVLLSFFYGVPGFLFAIAVLAYSLGTLHFPVEEPHELLLSNSVEQVFSVLFWFVLLGPAGAAFYRLIQYATQTEQEAEKVLIADTLQKSLDWIPVRLLGFCFALVGHFSSVISYWVTQLFTGMDENVGFLLHCFHLAYGAEAPSVEATELSQSEYMVQLLQRTLIVWLVVLALLVLF